VYVDAIPPAAVGIVAEAGGGTLEKWQWLLLVLLAVIVLVWLLLRKQG
jgi:predicted ABC-type sugar transport system permease subunit